MTPPQAEPTSGPAPTPLLDRLDAELSIALPALSLDWAQKLALNSFYPVLRARVAQNEAAAVGAMRQVVEMLCRVGGFSAAALASTDELAAELERRKKGGE